MAAHCNPNIHTEMLILRMGMVGSKRIIGAAAHNKHSDLSLTSLGFIFPGVSSLFASKQMIEARKTMEKS